METQEKVLKGDKQSKLEQINDFVNDILLLATYAVESGRLPEQVKLADIYRAYSQKVEAGMPLSGSDIELLQYYYQLLKIELDPVTPSSLRATQCNFDNDAMDTEAGKSVRKIWHWAFASMLVILSISLYQHSFEFNSASWAIESPDTFGSLTMLYWIAMSLAPFSYGALGASVRILRAVESRLRDRSFDPRRIPEHRTRWVLGTLSGGIIVMFYSSGGVGETSVKLTEVGVGFLAGYSIDLFFSVLDNLVSILSPASTSASQSPRKTKIQVPLKIAEIKKDSTIQVDKTLRTSKDEKAAHV